VTLVFKRLDEGHWQHVSSEIAAIEIAAIRDVERRRRVRALLPPRRDIIHLSTATFRRASQLGEYGFSPADAVHVAAAEELRADVLLSCDDRLCRLGRRYQSKLKVLVANPLAWLKEHADDANP